MIRTYQSMIEQLEKTLGKTPIGLNIFIAVLAYAATRVSNIILDISYAASEHPVAFYIGQTAFKGETIKSYYASMINGNTLDIYWKTQFIDFGFIITTFIAGLIVSLFLARINKQNSFLYKLSLIAAIAIPLGASLDAFENFISFIMLSQPLSFANWIAYIYSSFAVLKFAALAVGYMAWVVALFGFFATQIFKVFKHTRRLIKA